MGKIVKPEKALYKVLFGSLAGILLFFSSCEAIFTTTPFGGMRRDIADLPLATQITVATQILASGTEEEAAEAYTAIDNAISNDPNNASLNELASDLAIKASGIPGAMDGMIQIATDGNFGNAAAFDAEFVSDLNSFDYAMVSNSKSKITTAVANGAAVSSDQYLLVAVGLVFNDANDAGGFASIGTNPPAMFFVDSAVADLQSRGEDPGYLLDLKSWLNGL